MPLIDTHCHLTFQGLCEEIDSVLERSRAAGVSSWITVGTDLVHSQLAIELAKQQEGIYATVGLHPHDAKDYSEEMYEQFKQMALESCVVAIGETGLDFHYDLSPRKRQMSVFASHLELAQDQNLPVVVHSRDAFDETLEVLVDFRNSLDRVVFHCFTGGENQVEILLERGYYISYTGVVTFKNATEIRGGVAKVPMDRLMIETDCPYMSPVPMRKQRVNEPALLTYTAKFLAELKGVSLDEFTIQTSDNSRQFFGL